MYDTVHDIVLHWYAECFYIVMQIDSEIVSVENRSSL